MFSPYPLTTYHLLGAALYLSFIKEAVSRGFPVPPRVLLLRSGDEQSSKSREKVEGECWMIFLKEWDSVREQGRSLNEAPHDTDTQISSDDYCPGSACVLAPLLQIHGHTLVWGSSHTQLLYILRTCAHTQTGSLTPVCHVHVRWCCTTKMVRNKTAQNVLSHTHSLQAGVHILSPHTPAARLSWGKQVISVLLKPAFYLSSHSCSHL